MEKFSPSKNYIRTRKLIGYVEPEKATLADYRRIGFKSGLEVHQQLLTSGKLFCRCPAGIYHHHNEYDAEVIRHMRPTLSELGIYDGTALMEFRTRKEITYRINNETACTYEVDDTPPFPIDREALAIALRISLMCNLNIVGEVHITRKQYLDGSIPTGFQRSAILGVEGYLQLKKKKVRLIQLSIEEDSCREISDIGHSRVYKTDRLGMPLIETVTYPDMETPAELVEAAEYIRFLNRSSGLVRTGMGAGREDVNVSCEGGSRVEIKGVARNSWIPHLSHNEAFRQYALLNIRSLLLDKIPEADKWNIVWKEIGFADTSLHSGPVRDAFERKERVIAINLPACQGILSHFTQPGKMFADELSDRLKVIACIEKPNMTHSEETGTEPSGVDFTAIARFLGADRNDAQIVLWGPDDDIKTAIETVEERMKLAFEGVPNETRKSFADGTTIFERVLPGRDRMYPDTDSPPIPLSDEYIEELRRDLPVEIAERFRQMQQWKIPSDTHKYLLSKNLVEMVERIADDFGYKHRFVGCFLGHTLKNLEGKRQPHKNFNYKKIYGMFGFLASRKLDPAMAKLMLPVIYDNPDMEFGSVLTSVGFRKKSVDELLAPVDFLHEKFLEIRVSERDTAVTDWMMGQIRRQAIGNTSLTNLSEKIKKKLSNGF